MPSPSSDIHVLTPSTRKQRPFPRMALSVVFTSSVIAMLIGKPPESVDVALKLAAILAGCALGSWAETWVFDLVVGKSKALRVFLAVFLPPASIILGLTLAMPLGLLAQSLGDDGVLLTAGFFSAFWMASAAAGSLVVVMIDALISAFVPDFRSRVQLAVLGLLIAMTCFIGAVTWLGGSIKSAIMRYAPEIKARAALEDWKVNLGEGPQSIEELQNVLGDVETANLFALIYFLVIALLTLPALLSACGKLADTTMERLHPLSLAFAELARGDLQVRVEEAGSRDFVKLSRGFNQMARAQAQAFDQIRNLNANLEQQVEARTHDLQDALNELTNAQAKLVESEKQAMLGRLVAGILHEINTPLGALRSSADTMDRSLQKLDAFVQAQDPQDKATKRAIRTVEANRKLCGVLDQSSTRIEALMSSLSQFVSLDSAEYKQHDVTEGVESALTLLSKRIGERISVVRSTPEEALLVRCYPAKLNQVFFNVLDNAVTALQTQDGSAQIRIDLSQDAQQVRICIEDNGPGIDLTKRDDLFDFGFTKKEGGRMGLRLGLPSSKRWVEELNGQFTFQSEPGGGTRIEILLPKTEPEASA